MRKMHTIYLRDTRVICSPVSGDINPLCQWVFDGEGFATRKIDGVNVRIENGMASQRIKPETPDYYKADYGVVTDENVRRAIESRPWDDGIYEAYGEGIKGNPERIAGQSMVRILPVDHALILSGAVTNYRALMAYLSTHNIEGIVWHSYAEPETMAKITTRDFFHLHRPGTSPLA